MLCPKCGKESKNQRVCGHCQTPYPADMIANHGARSGGANPLAGVLSAIGNASPAVRWGTIGVIVAALAMFLMRSGRERAVPVGVAMPNVVAAPMSAGEAEALLKNVAASAAVDVQGDVVTVRVRSSLPEKREGILAYAQQYARADELVSGKKRMIRFLEPGGAQFAQADPQVGVTLVK